MPDLPKSSLKFNVTILGSMVWVIEYVEWWKALISPVPHTIKDGSSILSNRTSLGDQSLPCASRLKWGLPQEMAFCSVPTHSVKAVGREDGKCTGLGLSGRLPSGNVLWAVWKWWVSCVKTSWDTRVAEAAWSVTGETLRQYSGGAWRTKRNSLGLPESPFPSLLPTLPFH